MNELYMNMNVLELCLCYLQCSSILKWISSESTKEHRIQDHNQKEITPYAMYKNNPAAPLH